MRFSSLSACFLGTLGICLPAQGAEIPPGQLKFFEAKIRPILVNECYECHSAEGKAKGGLRVDTREDLLEGGESGPAIVPKDLKESLLITAIRHLDSDLKMPKKRKLPERVIADFTKWVQMGAPDPRSRSQDSAPEPAPSEIDYEKGRQYWAFQAPQKRSVPDVKNTAWPRSEVDRFLLAAMEERGIIPVSDADKRALVRRLYFDLIGLPPTPKQVEAFLTDDSNDATAKLIDTLLASPHFGERWGRHWLDVSRFGESNGMERNFTYPHAWKYRDYVIASFNRDKPYDQFVREQIAGDLLAEKDAPGTTAEERSVATGFLALGPKILNERDKVVFQMEMVDEQIDASSRAVLGLTVSCARCHDHKFDPIGMQDYYALAGIFTSTRTLYGTKGGGGNRQASELMTVGEVDPGLASRHQEHSQKLAATQKKLAQATKQFQNLNRNKGKNNKANNKKKRNNRKNNNKGNNVARVNEMRQRMGTLKKEVATLRKNSPPPPPVAMGVSEGSAGDCKLCLRGDAKKRGPVVKRGFPKVFPHTSEQAVAEGSGRRELANWLVSPENPLPARVMVNRVWHHLFGTGLVRTVDNFGKMGEAPVNQALLDHLAVNFMEQNWSVKTLIRELTNTRAYQLSSRHNVANHKLDPENRLCWQMSHRRLEAEAIRDAILSASGQLNPEPFTGSVVQSLGDTNYGRSNRDLGAGPVAHHRSIYLPIIRNAVPEALRVFDFAEPSLIVGRRAHTTVPTQALYLLNDPFVLKQTELMGTRLLEEASNDNDRLTLAYQLTLSRSPTTLERERSLALVKEFQEALSGKSGPQAERLAWASLAQSLIATAEFRYLD